MKRKSNLTTAELLLGAILLTTSVSASIQAIAFWKVHQTIQQARQGFEEAAESFDEPELPQYQFGN